MRFLAHWFSKPARSATPTPLHKAASRPPGWSKPQNPSVWTGGLSVNQSGVPLAWALDRRWAPSSPRRLGEGSNANSRSNSPTLTCSAGSVATLNGHHFPPWPADIPRHAPVAKARARMRAGFSPPWFHQLGSHGPGPRTRFRLIGPESRPVSRPAPPCRVLSAPLVGPMPERQISVSPKRAAWAFRPSGCRFSRTRCRGGTWSVPSHNLSAPFAGKLGRHSAASHPPARLSGCEDRADEGKPGGERHHLGAWAMRSLMSGTSCRTRAGPT